MAKRNSNDRFYQDYKNRTEGNIRREIVEQTKKVNARLENYDFENASNFVKQSIYRINLLAGVKTENAQSVQSGVYDQKGRKRTVIERDKESLIRQARELKAFLKWDFDTPEGKRKLEEREQKAFEQFKSNMGSEYEDITYDDWRTMVENFGALGQDIITPKTSDDFVDAYKNASSKGKVKFSDIYKQLEKESKSQGWDTNKMLKEFKLRLKEYSE